MWVMGSRARDVRRLLGRRFEAPTALRYPVYLLTAIVAWSVVGLAGAGFVATLCSGAVAGLVAELGVEAWWVRRERRRDRASGYVPTTRGDER